MQIPRVPLDYKIYMNGYGMGGNLCRNFFGFVSLWCWILLDFLSSFGILFWKLVGGWKRRWSDEMMVLPRGSARHVFFPVHKIGFCLSQKRGCLDSCGTSILYFIRLGCILRILPFIVRLSLARELGCDTGISFWDTALNFFENFCNNFERIIRRS